MASDPAPRASDNPIERVAGPFVRLMQIAMGWVLVGICLATVWEIVARQFGSSIQGVNEIGAYLLAVASSWGFSAALLSRAHSRVDFLFPHFPPLLQSVLNAVAAVTLAGLALFSVWQAWGVLADTLRWQARASTPLQTPMWIPQSLWMFGLGVFAVVSGACAIHATILLFRDRRRLDALYGPPSIQEQIEIETQGTLPHPMLPHPAGEILR
jgi:TRAP-type C4-dicarboxylate transport system permease small subunit